MSETSFPTCPTPFNLAQYVLCNAQPRPDKIALEILGSEPEAWSYRALTDAVLGVATGLVQSGLQSGAIVMLRLGNTADFPIAYLGVIAAGMIACPTSSALTPSEITKMTGTIQPQAILQNPALAKPDASDCTFISLDNLRQMYRLPAANWHFGDPNRPAYMVFTSGTSGVPRAVLHAHRAIWARRMMHRDWSEITKNDRLLHAGAFNWTYTLGTGLMDPWSVGATALIAQENTALSELGYLLAQSEASIFAAAPGVFRKMLKEELPELPKLNHALSAGEKMAPNIHQDWHDATGLKIYEAFGMSECSTFISASPSKPVPSSGLGKPQSGRKIALLDAQGNEVRKGETGVIAVHRTDPGLMLEYFNAPEETKERFQGDWFLSGDLAMQDEDGVFHYQGRADDMMNAGGFRVSPIEIEAVFETLDSIAQCAAIEISVKADTSVIALCYLAANPVQESTLQALATDQLARYKRPRIYHQCDTLPLSANGKLLRRVLRSQIEALYGQA